MLAQGSNYSSFVGFRNSAVRDARYHLLGLPINTNTIFYFNILPKQNITISKYKLAISKSSKYVSSQRYVETILNKIRFTYPQKYPISNPNHHIYLTKENTVHKWSINRIKLIHYTWITLKINLKINDFMLKCKFSLILPIDLIISEEGKEMYNNNTIPILNFEQANI